MSRGIKKILEKYKFRPSKRLGQNFLVDDWVLSKIVEAAELKPNDIVLEVGPGIGNLTLELAKRAKKVIAVEKDPKMVEILQETLKGFRNVEIIQGDILKIQNSKFKIQNSHKVVANLPYYITSPVIRKFLEAENPPEVMVLMVQKEVAQRICAKPPRMNLLAVSVQFYVHPHTKFGVGARPKIIGYVSKNCFWPSPKVDSAIIKITPKSPAEERPLSVLQRKDLCKMFFKIVKAGFSQPRKQLVNNLAKGLALNEVEGLKLNREEVKNWLLENNIQPSQRAETLSVDDWLNLAKCFKIK